MLFGLLFYKLQFYSMENTIKNIWRWDDFKQSLNQVSTCILKGGLFIFFSLGLSLYSQDAQILITNPSGINVCDTSEEVGIQITNISGEPLTNISIVIDLPSGITYVPSSLVDQSSFNITEQNISNLASIILSIDDLPNNQMIAFKIYIEANMDAITYQNSGNVFRNELTLNYDTGTTNSISNAYNLYYPVLTITNIQPSSINLNSGDSFNRQITVVNAGNGRLYGFKIKDLHASGITISAVDIGTLESSNTIIALAGVDFNSVGNGDNYFDTNESITITELVVGSGCENTTITSTFSNFWECAGSQIESDTSFTHVSLALKAPSISAATTSELTSCFGDSEVNSHSIIFTNNGQGKAIDLELDLYKSTGAGYEQNIFSRIDESTITYQIAGGASGTITPSTTYATNTSGDYTCLEAGAIGRVLLTLPDLEPNAVITISFNTYHCNINVCNGDLVKGWKFDLGYNDVCESTSYSKSATGQNTNNTNMTVFVESPSDINDGETKEFTFNISSFSNDLPEASGAGYKVVFNLPNGIEYSNLEFYHNVTWTATSINYDTSSNVVTAYYDLPLPSGFEFSKSTFIIDLTGNCNMAGASTGTLNIEMDVYYIPSSNCNFEIPFVCSESVLVDLHCSDGSSCEGMRFESFNFERTSFGQPDNDQNGLPDTSGSIDFTRVKTKRVMLGDSIRGTFTGTIFTTTEHTDWTYAFVTQTIEKGTYFTSLEALLSVYDASSDSYLTCSIIPVSVSIDNLDKTFTYNLSSDALSPNCSSFTGFKYESGDIVTLQTNYNVSSNIGGSVSQIRTNNEFFTSTTAIITESGKYQCGYYNDNITLIGYYFKNASRNYYTVKNCNKSVSQHFYLSIGDCCSNYNGGNLFPSEYRNWAHIKTATVAIPPNYEASNFSLKMRRTRKTNSTVTETVAVNPSQIVGNVLTFDLEQYYIENGGSINFSDDGFKGTLTMDLSPNCEVPINNYEPLTWKFDFVKGDFLGGGTTGLIEATNPDQIKFNPPSLVINSDNPTVDGIVETVSWDVKISTTSSSIDADYSWIHLKNPKGTTQILQVIDDDTGEEISATGDIYRLGFIDGSSEKDLTIIAKYTACTPDYIIVYAGYECTAYPDNFSDFTCAYTTLGLFVAPQPAAMQATLTGVNVGDVCGSTVQLEVAISSVKIGSIKNILVEFQPVGNTMTYESGSGQILYPLSGTYAAVNDPSVNESGNYEFEINSIEQSIFDNGLPGVLDLSNNHFKLKFNMELDGSFQSGHYALVRISSESMCGEANPTINLAFDPSIGFLLNSTSGLTSSNTDSWSASWGDFNNDGYDDLFVTTYDATKPNLLYKNNGNKTFSIVSTGAIVTDLAKSVGASWGDFNNDGYIDLFVANNAGSSNFLYKNNGNETFTKIVEGDIVTYGVYCHSAAWADYDNDGYLDLFVAEYFPTNTNHLFHNNGDETFTRVENSPVVTDAGHSIGAAWGDYNNDGLVDLFVPNTNNEGNWLYKNIGNGQFEKVNENVLSTPSKSVGCSWGDYNNDGYLDLFVANAGNSNNNLYINNTDGTFSVVTTGPVVSDLGNSHGSVWIDIDNDGDLDLYVTNDQDEDNFLYKNNGDETFSRAENDLTKLGGNSFGTAISDYDNDGDYDIFVSNHSDTSNFFFENTKGQCAEYYCMNLIGTNSNESAIGASVHLKATINGQAVWQRKDVSSQSGGGAGGQSSNKLIFGLRNTTNIDSLIIKWPSGFKKIYTNISTSSNCTTYIEDDGTQIIGVAYVDENLNCSYDIGEPLMKNIKITIGPNNIITYTNTNGEYAFYMNTGIYSISAETPTYYTQYCPTNNESHSVEVETIGGTIPSKDFGFIADGTHSDVSVCMSTTVLRKNFTNDYIVAYDNIGNNDASGNRITITLNEGIDFISSSIPWTNQTGQTAYWDIQSIEAQTSESFIVTVSVTTSTSIGDEATNSVTITSSTADTNTGNNTCTDVSIIVGSIDPNDKLVFPEGVLPFDNPLTYKIRFQNMGNYPAESIVVYDTLQPTLDVETLCKIETSHDAIFTILEGHILKWEFPFIELPDVEHNEPESHGYVQFEIFPAKNISANTTIENTATIIFDYYQSTVTNVTSIRVNPNEDGSSLILYPVPTRNHISVQYESGAKETVHIDCYNLYGQLIQSKNTNVLEGWNRMELDVSELPSGVYILSVRSLDLTISGRFIKL